MQTFDQAVYERYKSGEINYDEALKNADSVNEVRLMIKLGAETGEVPDDSDIADLSVQNEDSMI